METQLTPGYQLLEEIGRGGMARVFRAYHPATNRNVAIKIIQATILQDQTQIRERFKREAHLIAQLEHPYILPVHDFNGDSAMPYIVMRYLSGGTFKTWLEQPGITPGEILRLLRQVAQGLAFAHRQGVIHRDIKPSNILLDSDGNCFVSDFGIAAMLPFRAGVPNGTSTLSLTANDQFLGTPNYIAPEQITGEETIGVGTDEYAFAVMTFEALTGRLPFTGDTLYDLLNQHLTGAVPSAHQLNPTLPALIDTVFQRALAKSPANRYESIIDFVETLEETLFDTRPILTTMGASQSQSTAARPTPDKRDSTTHPGLSVPLERHKQVTLLYIDVRAHAEALYARLEDDGPQESLHKLMCAVEDAVVLNGGTLRRLTAETATAIWGSEITREDDAERAVKAALALRDDVFARFEGGIVAMRIAITTGLIFSNSRDTDAKNNLAGALTMALSRLIERVPAQQIGLTHETFNHVLGVFELEALTTDFGPGSTGNGASASAPGAHPNADQTAALYVVHKARPRAFRRYVRGVEGIETQMVGREAELKKIQQAFLLTIEDEQAQVVTVVGEAGMGKSRLCYEFINWLDLQDRKVWLFLGRSTQESARQPFALVRDLFSTRFEISDNDSVEVMRQKFVKSALEFMGGASTYEAHLIGQLLGFDFSAEPLIKEALARPDSFRTEAMRSLANFFQSAARQHPIVAIIEDIHWADEQSLTVLKNVIEFQRNLPIMVLYLARPSLYERRPTWGEGQDYHLQLRLDPLSRLDARGLVREILQKVENIPQQLRDLIIERTDGNPYYIEEIIKTLIQDKVIIKTADTWRVDLNLLSRLRIPGTLTGLLQARLDMLPPEYLVILQRAAVIGRLFWDTAVEAISGADPAIKTSLSKVLEGLRQRELIQLREQSIFAGAREYVFRHAILRDVVYETLPLRARRIYHKQVAEWLQATSGARVGEYLLQIADHYEQAHEFALAANAITRASKQARLIGTFTEAAVLLQSAQRLVAKDESLAGQQAWLAAQLGLAEIAGYIADYQNARTHLTVALETARRIDEKQTMADALAQLGRLAYWSGNYDEALRYLEQGLPIARMVDHIPTLIFVLRQYGNVIDSVGKHEVAQQVLEESLTLARKINDAEATSLALNSLAHVYLNQNRVALAYQYFEDALGIARQNGNRYSMALFLLNLAWMDLCLSHYEAALANAGEAQLIAHENKAQGYVAIAEMHCGAALIGLGNETEGLPRLNFGVKTLQDLDETPDLLSALRFYAMLDLKYQRLEQGLRLVACVLAQPALPGCERPHLETLRVALEQAAQPVLGETAIQDALREGRATPLETLLKPYLSMDTPSVGVG